MKHPYPLFFLLCFVLFLNACTTEDTFEVNPIDEGGVLGSGTPNDPFQLATAQQLDELVRSSPSSNFLLVNNIDLTSYIAENYASEGWLPVNGFVGVLDGGDFTLSGFWIDRPTTDNVGFFGEIGGDNNTTTNVVTIRNLILEVAAGVSVTGQSRVGGLIGNANDGVLVANVHITGADATAKVVSTAVGSDTSLGRTGGLIGNADRSIVNQCSSSVSVESGMSNRIGGLVGMLNFSTIDQSFATGDISSEAIRVGGLVGFANGAGTSITNSYATGAVSISASSTDDIGGFIGASSSSIVPETNIANCYSTGSLQLDVPGYVPGFAPGNSDSFGVFSGDGDGGSSIFGSTAQTIVNGSGDSLFDDATDQGAGFNLLNVVSSTCVVNFSSFDASIWACSDGSFPVLISNPE